MCQGNAVFPNEVMCARYNSLIYLIPTLLILTSGVTVVIVSYRPSSSAFIFLAVASLTTILFIVLLPCQVAEGQADCAVRGVGHSGGDRGAAQPGTEGYNNSEAPGP